MDRLLLPNLALISATVSDKYAFNRRTPVGGQIADTA